MGLHDAAYTGRVEAEPADLDDGRQRGVHLCPVRYRPAPRR
jgi:hypothetical protein